MSENDKRPIDRFLDQLQQWVKRDDRAALANLRRGFSETTEHRAWPYLAEWCDLANDRDRTIWRTIAAGAATLESSANTGNLGVTLRELALGRSAEKKDEALNSFAGRFRRLLACDSVGELCDHLTPIFRAAKQKEIPVNFRQLFWDLVKWGNDPQAVRTRWAQAYWGVRTEEGGETP